MSDGASATLVIAYIAFALGILALGAAVMAKSAVAKGTTTGVSREAGKFERRRIASRKE